VNTVLTIIICAFLVPYAIAILAFSLLCYALMTRPRRKNEN
jgi:hypothetical protein